MNRTGAGSLRREDAGKRVLLRGWVHQRRPHGGLTFLNLRDRSGRVQVVVRPEEFPAAATALEPARLEWVVEVRGTVAEREPGAVNRKMETGEIEVVAEEAVVLAAAEPLPFGPETPVEEVAEEMLKEFLASIAAAHPEIAALNDAECALVKGIPATRILEAAKARDVRGIVMGSRGRTGLPHLLLGSKAERVAQLSPVPVTIVKAAAPDD